MAGKCILYRYIESRCSRDVRFCVLSPRKELDALAHSEAIAGSIRMDEPLHFEIQVNRCLERTSLKHPYLKLGRSQINWLAQFSSIALDG